MFFSPLDRARAESIEKPKEIHDFVSWRNFSSRKSRSTIFLGSAKIKWVVKVRCAVRYDVASENIKLQEDFQCYKAKQINPYRSRGEIRSSNLLRGLDWIKFHEERWIINPIILFLWHSPFISHQFAHFDLSGSSNETKSSRKMFINIQFADTLKVFL